MKYTKNLIKILLLTQCFLFFCTCEDNAKTETIIRNEYDIVDFITCPFNEKFDDKTNLEKYVLKKFGKPEIVWKERKRLGDHKELPIVVDWIVLIYNNDKYKSKFEITRGINKRLDFFNSILILDFTDLKYGINNGTTIKDIEKLFGTPYVKDIEDGYELEYRHGYVDDIYIYELKFVFRKKKLNAVHIQTDFNPYRL